MGKRITEGAGRQGVRGQALHRCKPLAPSAARTRSSLSQLTASPHDAESGGESRQESFRKQGKRAHIGNQKAIDGVPRG